MVIVVMDIVRGCDTNDQGEKIFLSLIKGLSEAPTVTLSFDGVLNVTSSFVNSAFLPLLDTYDIEVIKSRLSLTSVNRQIANMVRDRMIKEVA